MFTIEFDHFDWLSKFYTDWRQTSKLVNFQDFISGIRFSSKLDNDQKCPNSAPFIKKNIWESSLDSNLIILTDFRSFTQNDDKLQN